MDSVKRDPNRVALPVLIGLITVVAFTPVFARLTNDPTAVARGVNDYAAHYERVEAFRWSPFRLPVPHPVYHLLVRVAELVVGPETAMTAVLVASIVAVALVLYVTGRRATTAGAALRRPWALAFMSLVLLGESPSVLVSSGPSWWQRAPGFDRIGRGAGFVNLHVWGSPTITTAWPLYLAMVPLGIALFRGNLSTARRVQIGALTTVACLTMPAIALSLAPALVVLLVATKWPERTASTDSTGSTERAPASRMTRARTASWIVVPALVVCLWQAWFLATSQSPLEEERWTINPFWLVEYFGLARPGFWLLYLLPLTAVACGGRRAVRDPHIAWAATASAIALGPMMLLQETGWKATHGGMAVSFGLCSGLLAVYSIRFLLLELQAAWDARSTTRPGLATIAAVAILALVLAAGMLDHLAAVGVIREW